MTENTVVIFTADHGDMLGERGLWYKMNFFEHASRVPLIFSGPGVSQGRSTEHVSLVDLTPTLTDLTGAPAPLRTDGTSLVSLLGGDHDPSRVVLGEYLAEGAIAPIFMVRKGRHKFVRCDADPDQLYDLVDDPNELVNLATDPRCAQELDAMRALAAERWDSTQIHTDVVENQRSRRLVDQALRNGTYTPWDYQPHADASQRFMRNHLDLNLVESSRRLPSRR